MFGTSDLDNFAVPGFFQVFDEDLEDEGSWLDRVGGPPPATAHPPTPAFQPSQEFTALRTSIPTLTDPPLYPGGAG
jgi:hypothetical protein